MSHKHDKRGHSVLYVLEETQVWATVGACHDLIDRIIIKSPLFLGGLRVGEMTHMGDDWITSEGKFRIPSFMPCNCAECARVRDGGWKPKTPAGARILYVPKLLREDLAELFKAQPYGLDISRQAIWYRTKRILKEAKVRFRGLSGDTGFSHCLRATCATMLAATDINEVALCYYMGWSDINQAKPYIQMVRGQTGAFKWAKELFG